MGAQPVLQLARAPAPLAVIPSCIALQSERLVIKEKVLSLSGDSFDILSEDGRPVFRIKGQAMSMSGRKHLTDMDGNFLFDIRKKLVSLHPTYYGEDASGKQLFNVRNRFKFFSSKAECTFTSSTGKQEMLTMEGNWRDTRADITSATGQVVASISRSLWNAREMLGGKQTYTVTIAPSVDMALVVALCVCLDEERNEH